MDASSNSLSHNCFSTYNNFSDFSRPHIFISDNMKLIIRRINKHFSTFILIIFYLLVIPFGKFIYIITTLSSISKKTNSYWKIYRGKEEIDLNSPY